MGSHLGQGASVAQALNALCGAMTQPAGQSVGSRQVRFVEQAELPAEQAYETFVFETGAVPTRHNLHDAFNGLSWLHFPKTKRRLNQLQASQIARDGILPTRGKIRDAVTVFDENAAFLQAPDALWDALVSKQWHVLFGNLQNLWPQARLVLFGHALLEKLAEPRPGITAHVYRVAPQTDSLVDWDSFVANDLSLEKLAAKPFAHLPVLGVPGWWQANREPGFYDDAAVFRPLRRAA